MKAVGYEELVASKAGVQSTAPFPQQIHNASHLHKQRSHGHAAFSMVPHTSCTTEDASSGCRNAPDAHPLPSHKQEDTDSHGAGCMSLACYLHRFGG